ncbi:MAG: hypothetical protein IJ849_07630 [Selenomonadaceae bacterium]|nr:hypothetical protein [Selenomonadaceae bacterium]
MSALRKEAISMVNAMPEAGLEPLMRYLMEYNLQQGERERRIQRKKAALDEILSLSKYLPDLDEEKGTGGISPRKVWLCESSLIKGGFYYAHRPCYRR